jgi:hypothetical protein
VLYVLVYYDEKHLDLFTFKTTIARSDWVGQVSRCPRNRNETGSRNQNEKPDMNRAEGVRPKAACGTSKLEERKTIIHLA